MAPPSLPRPRRRAFLLGVGGVALAAVSGCSFFSPEEPVIPTVVQTPGLADPVNGLIATTRLHALRLDAAIAAVPEQAPLLTALRDDRLAQLAALEKEYLRVNPPATSSAATGTTAPTTPTGPPPTAQIELTGSPEEIISAVRGDAATAQVQFTDAISTASRYRAAMFGSIAAALATHRAVLA